MLFCLVAVFSCDNRKVCIEADDFGFEDIERFDVQSFLSPQNEGADCSYRQEENGFSSINTDLYYCLNGVASGQDHCAESYDGYVAYKDSSVTKYCRFINNDINDELTSGEMSCLNPNDNPFRNKGCNIGSTDIPAGPPFIFSSTTWGAESVVSASLPAIAEIKANCVNSCVERCRKKKACSHIASRQPIKKGATDVTSGALYDIFNPYNGTFPLKHSLDGNLFVASVSVSVQGVDNYVFTWTDSSSELKQMFSQLTNQENRNKLSLAIKTAAIKPADDRSILIEDFDSCSFSVNDFICKIDKNRDLATKDKFSRFFPPVSTLNAVAIFDYVKIQSNGININDRIITTQTQHHLGTNSIVEIVSSLAQYKIKVKKILDSKHFIYEEIADPATINNIASSCSTTGNCFLIPSVENVDWQDKFMPPWKATTSKSSATATGGLQISAGSKVEIEATGQITLGSSEEKVCHKNITSYNPNLYEETSGSCGSTPKIFNFAANTKYQPNVKIISIPASFPASLYSKYTLYRSLTTTENGNITHDDNSNYNDLCKSFCYIKITATTPLSVADFACDASVPEIKKVPSSTNCKYSSSIITTQYDSAKEQVRIANYAKKVIIDSLATSVEDVNVASYTPPTLAQPFPPSSTNIEKTYPYSDLKINMPTSYNSPLLVYFDNFGNCEINVRIQTDATNLRDVYQDLGGSLKLEGNAINAATSSISSIVYPGATLYLKQTNGNCSNLTITPYPYIEFTAMQSGFIDFKSANTCQLKQTRVVNNNINYPRRKAETGDGGINWKWVQAYNNSYQHNIVPGNSFVDVLLNKIANKIFNIYQSFAASPVVTTTPEGIYNKQGVNDNSKACDTCFATAITKTVVDNTCGAVPSSGCGGLKSAITYNASGVLTATPQDGKPGKITITFLDGEELIYNNPGVYHLSFNADRKITKIEAIGGGGGASYDFQSSTANNGGNAKILKIEALSGGVNIIVGIDGDYKTENRYTLKIMVGHGGKNSTEINDYRTFSQISHRDSYNYALYKKDFGYAGGFGEASVVGFVHKTTPNKIKILAFAGGGGGGAGRTCNNSIGAFGISVLLKPNQHLLHNATYEYLQNVVQCSVGQRFLQNVAIPKLNCDSILNGSPGFCGTGRCSIANANTVKNQATASSDLNHGDRIYCITGYTEALTSPSVALTANCAVASGPGTIVGGSCVINTCTAPSSPIGYTLPAVFTYNYNTTSTAITGSSCASGYSGAANATYTCNNTTGGSVSASISASGCNANCSATLANATVNSSQHNGTATCSTGYNSSTGGTIACNNGNWNGVCNINQCNVSLTNGATSTTKYNYNTSLSSILADITAGSVACNTGYSKPNLSSNFTTCTTNNNTVNIGSCTINTCPALANSAATTIQNYNTTATCSTGYGGNGTQTRTCQANGTWSGACAINTCTAPSSPIGYTLPAVFTYNYATTSTAIAGSSCAIGYSGTANATYTCNNTNGESVPASITTASGCNANCSATLANATVNSSQHNGTATCSTGYKSSTGGTIACNNGNWNGSCTIYSCGTLANSNYFTISGEYGDTATCNGDSGYGSSTPGSHPVCQANGNWSASCRWNSCNVNQIAGYNTLPETVDNTNSDTNLLYLLYRFNSTVSCQTGYSSIYGTAVYRCWNTNTNGTNININPDGCTINVCNIANASGNKTHNTQVSCDTNYGIVDKQTVYAYCSTNNGIGTLRTAQNGGGSAVSCEQKFYEEYGEFKENSSPVFYSNGNYNMRYLNVEYGRWWNCVWHGTGTCWKTYNKDNTDITNAGTTQWTLNVGNGICGDPKPGCDKKAKVWVGYCLRQHCRD